MISSPARGLGLAAKGTPPHEKTRTDHKADTGLGLNLPFMEGLDIYLAASYRFATSSQLITLKKA
jgi:hypothetical protein